MKTCSDFKHSFLTFIQSSPFLPSFSHTLQPAFSLFPVHTILRLHFFLYKVPLNLLAGFCLNIWTYTSPLMWVLAPSRPIFWACHLSLGYSLPKLCKSCLRLQKPGEFLLILLSLTFLFLVGPIYITFAVIGGTRLSNAPSPSIEYYPDDLGKVFALCSVIV